MVAALAIGAFFYFGGQQYLSFETLKANRDRLLAYTQEHYVTAALIFVTAYLPAGRRLPSRDALLTLLGGFLFGSVLGTFYVNLGATAGATLAFLAARYLFRDWVERQFGARLKRVQEEFSKHTFNYLLGLRLVPVMPFFLVNLLAGLTLIRVLTYVVATSLGMIPASFVYAYAGRELGSMNSLDEVTAPGVLLALTLLALLAIAPVVYREWTAKKKQGHA